MSFAVKIGQQMVGEPQIKHIGDVDNGNHPVNLQFGPVLIDNPGTPVIINYAIVNSGHQQQSQLDLDTALSQGGGALAAAAGTALGGSSMWGLSLRNFPIFLRGIIFADCDGPVAGDQIELTGDSLNALTARFNSHTETRAYPGTDSATGCGSNSFYMVTWTILRIPPILYMRCLLDPQGRREPSCGTERKFQELVQAPMLAREVSLHHSGDITAPTPDDPGAGSFRPPRDQH